MGTPGKCIDSLGVANLTLLWGQNSPGRVSVTCDAWSSRELFSFFAVSAHIAVEDQKHEEEFGKVKLEGHNYLLAFRELEGEHSGKNIARLFYQVISEAGIKHKVSTHLDMSRGLH